MEALLMPMTRSPGRKLTTDSKLSGTMHNLFDETKRPHKEYLLWDHIVRRYTSTECTFPNKDKLVAIASVAHKLGLRDQLIAGLWRHRLSYQLLWRVYQPAVSTRADEWRAPSWSRQCINGRIDPQASENYSIWQPPEEQPRRDESLTNIVGITTQHRANDARDALISATMRLWAQIVKGSIKKDIGGQDTFYRFGSQEALVTLNQDCSAPIETDRVCYIMPILLTEEKMEKQNVFQCYGIFLESSIETLGQWSRAGFANIMAYTEGDNIGNFEKVLGAQLDDVSNVLDVDEKQRDGTPRYLIDLV